MSAIANSLHNPDRFDLSVKKFRTICVMHEVQIGSGADLTGFMQKLMDDRHLAMDFWAFVNKLTSREGGEFSDDQLLAIVTEGVTGGELSEDDGESKRALADLRAMLAGVDVQGTGQGQVRLAPFPPSETTQPYGESKIHAVEWPAKEPNSRTAPRPEPLNEDVDHRGVPAPPPLQLDEELLRLELTRLVKLYFESIDKSKLEQLEGPTSAGTIANAMTRRSLEEPDSDDLIHRPIGNSRLVLEPVVEPAEDTFFVAKTQAPPPRVPLEDYSEPPASYKKILLSLLFVLALFEGGLGLYRHRLSFTKEKNDLIQDIRKKIDALNPPDRSLPPIADQEKAASTIQLDPSQDETGQRSRPAEQPALQGTSTPPSRAIASHASVATALATSKIARVNPGNKRKVTVDHTVVPVERAPVDDISSADLAGAVKVTPAVMDAHLIASRVPVYPETAKIDGIEGEVVLQAIISTGGTVKHVHVLQGDSRLRSAATEAVYKWRYRPYLLNGRPVDVATTITVDFDLDR